MQISKLGGLTMMSVRNSLWMCVCLLSVAACGVAGDAAGEAEAWSTAEVIKTDDPCPDQRTATTSSVECEITDRDGSVQVGFQVCREICTSHFRFVPSPPRCEVVSVDCGELICGVCIAFR
jgi:hypothetical protein